MSVTGIALFSVRDKQLIPSEVLAIEPQGKNWLEKAEDLYQEILRRGNLKFNVAIEEPIYSWGRKNPKGFAKQNLFLGSFLTYMEPHVERLWIVNPKSAKLNLAGTGKADKDMMIKKATWFVEKDLRKWGQTLVEPFRWPTRKTHREACADAIAIGYTAWRYHMKQIDTGVERLF